MKTNHKIYYCLAPLIFGLTTGLVYATESSNDPGIVPASPLVNQLRTVDTIVTTYAAPLFATNPLQTIYSSSLLSGAGSCAPSAVQTTTIIPSTTYSIQTKYYATHVHYECDTTTTGWCVTTNGHDPNESRLNGQSLTQPASTCGIKLSASSARCRSGDVDCGSKAVCSVSDGTWYPFYTYTPNPAGSFVGAYMCIEHGWNKSPIQ